MPIPVVRIITRLNIGGPSIQAATLTSRLEAHGFHTHLVHGRLGAGEGDMQYLLPAQGDGATYLHALQRPLAPAADLGALMQIYRLLCRVRPAIVHTHMAKAGAVGRTAAVAYNRTAGRQRPARLVHTYHGHVLEGYFGAAKTSVFIRTERVLARATDRLIAISPRIRDELVASYRIGDASQYAVVPLGFDLSPFARIDDDGRRAARKELGLPADAPVVTTVGRLTAIKQHDLLLTAARTIVGDHPSAVFLVAGDGERRREIEAMARVLQVEQHVRFLGWRRDLATIYAATDVFVLTSRQEGTPVALIEAMASGVPGVSTDVGGVRDVIADATMGVLVPPDAAAGIAAGIRGLLSDNAGRVAMGARARAHVLGRFTLDRLVADMVSLYRRLL
jgi:glycosyltransferase involved in cell wall biosynthesis